MRWLGFDWDEGPEVGGPHAPYRQSERGEIYADVLQRLREAGRTYDCYCTNEEVEARRKASGSKLMGYDGFCRELTPEQVAEFAGRDPVARFRMPDGEIAFDDLVRGTITFHTDHVPDFAVVPRQRPAALHPGQPRRRRADGDHPRAARRGPALQHAAPAGAVRRAAGDRRREGDAAVRPPALRDGRRATRSCPSATPRRSLLGYRTQGFLPEGLLNYLALLGLGDRPRPRRLLDRGDGRRLRHRRRQPQPGPLRPEEGRGDQRRPHADAVARGPDPPRDPLPQGGGGRRRPGERRRRARCSSWPCRWSRSG